MLTFYLLIVAITVAAQDGDFLFVFLNKNPQAEQITKEQSEKLMEGHMANINKLAGEGKLLAAGPFEGGGGMFILNTISADVATEWLSADPGVRARRWNIEYLPYKPRIGSVCPVSENYEMVDYFFIRYTSIVSKFNAGTYPALLAKHASFLDNAVFTSSIVTEGAFDNEGNSILILKQPVSLETLEADPAVQEGLLTIGTKKLYIAKGTFCEK